jgi:hypothetical protein
MYRTWPHDIITLNARCIEGIDIFDLDVENFDGKTKVPGGHVPPLPGSYAEND